MPDYIDVNTTSTYSTHFLRGVELIIRARDAFQVPSENWPYPTQYRFGIPNDRYYAEVWVDGMDWQASYWLIEENNLERPICRPFIIFESYEDRDDFNNSDFSELVKASLYERRDRLWIQKNDGWFNDSVWTYFKKVEPEKKLEQTPGMIMFQFEHASQERVQFYMNADCVPERKK
jgi:hypothetical protein